MARWVRVLRPIPAGGATIAPGVILDAGGWANLADLIAGEWVAPAPEPAPEPPADHEAPLEPEPLPFEPEPAPRPRRKR